MQQAVLITGSNQGDRAGNLAKAVRLLQSAGCELLGKVIRIMKQPPGEIRISRDFSTRPFLLELRSNRTIS
jgi:7,8-dihydro-6-hydroxymethylpterin-pyrophosphokinase